MSMIFGSSDAVKYIGFDFLDSTGHTESGYTLRGRGEWLYYPERDADRRNYQAVASAFHIKCEDMVRPWQRHTGNIRPIYRKHGGEGILCEPSMAGVDGLITNERSLMLCIIVSDCIPLYLVDTERSAIGLIHCGRQEIELGIAEHALQAMHEEYGCRMPDLKAVLGPHICRNCYEIGAEIGNKFVRFYDKAAQKRIFQQSGEHGYLDIGEALRLRLLKAGVASNRIFISPYCNLHDRNLFYSYRGGDGYNSNLAVLMLK